MWLFKSNLSSCQLNINTLLQEWIQSQKGEGGTFCTHISCTNESFFSPQISHTDVFLFLTESKASFDSVGF